MWAQMSPIDPSAPLPDSFGAIDLVAPADAPRMDRFLADAVESLSRTRIKALIEAGGVTADGRVVRSADAPVHEGALLRIVLPAPVAAAPLPQEIGLDILYEDADVIVLDKPAGLVVHPAPGSPDGTLVNALLAHCGDSLAGIGGERRPGIVHRLDKDTSGVMVVAKTELALTRLSAAFAARDIDRAYLAICWGAPAPPSGEIDGAIGRDPRDRKRMAVLARGGKAALTRYRTERGWLGAASLIECRLATGRTHQIRVHMGWRGHPLVGDPVYVRRVPAVSRRLPAELAGALLDFPRQALHAARLGFAHPISGAQLSFSRAPPADFAALLARLDAAEIS